MSTTRPTATDDVEAASDRFYDALEKMANGDASEMAAVWSHGDDVTTMHPIGGREVGWDEVKEPWEAVAGMSSDGRIRLTDQLLRVSGDLAYELGTETVSFTFADRPVEFEGRVTNVYRLEDDGWKIVHHHTDPSPAMIDVLEGLEGGA